MTGIVEQFRGVVARQPETVALTTAQRRYSYAEIDRWSDAVAARVIAANVPADRAVAIITRDNVALVPAAIGVVKAGHYFVMIDASDPAERIEWILRESNAAFTLTDDDLRFPADDPAPLPPRPPNALVYVIFTSGTTGKPKGVATAQRGFVEHILSQSERLGRAPGSRCTYTAVPGFVRAANNIFGTLLTGATMCAFDARSESLQALAAYIARERIELLTLTPSLFRRLVSAAPRDLDLSSVRMFRLGADRVTVADVQMFRKHFPRGCKLATGFASTESGAVFGMLIDHDTPVPGPLVPMGRPYAGVDVKLIDEDGHEVPVGETGEIVVRSDQVADGYWNEPELTARRFVIDPATPDVRTFFTGDLARRDENGIYYFVGRRDARLKIHGRRIDPSEVEGALLAGGTVREAVVIGKPQADGDERLVAYVVPQEGAAFDARALRSSLRASLPAWMVPARIYAIDTIPFTRANKVDRAALVARVELEEPDEPVAGDELEQELAAIWSRVIGTRVQLDDDFFDDLGGESIVAAHLVTEVQRATGYAVPLSFLLELNTVRKMAAHLRGSAEVDRLSVLIRDGGPEPPLFCVSGAGGSVIIFRRLAAILARERPVYGLQHHGFHIESFPKTRAAIAACYVESIRRIQPRGPYHVCGYSAGGQLAFETARQLERAGEEVAFLGVIDMGVSRRRVSAWRRMRNRLDFLRRRPWARGRAYLFEMLVLRPRTWLKRANVIAEPNRAYTETRGTLKLEPWSGTLTLFRARHGLGAICPDPDLGWGSVGLGGLDIHDVDGDHRSVLMEDVASLAEAFRRALT